MVVSHRKVGFWNLTSIVTCLVHPCAEPRRRNIGYTTRVRLIKLAKKEREVWSWLTFWSFFDAPPD